MKYSMILIIYTYLSVESVAFLNSYFEIFFNSCFACVKMLNRLILFQDYGYGMLKGYFVKLWISIS